MAATVIGHPRRQGPKKDYIEQSRFIRSAKSNVSPEYVVVNKFSDFNVLPLLQTNLKEMGFVTPSAIQDQDYSCWP